MRSASFGAFSDTASFGRTGSAPKSAMRGTMPDVETVMRDSGMPTAFHQQAHGLHEVVVVQERLTLSHEDEVDAVALQLDLLVVEHGENLAHDFARAQIALQPQQRGHAEGALDGAAHLAGDADGGALKAIRAGELSKVLQLRSFDFADATEARSLRMTS